MEHRLLDQGQKDRDPFREVSGVTDQHKERGQRRNS